MCLFYLIHRDILKNLHFMSALLCMRGVLLRSNDVNQVINVKDHILGVKKFYTSSCVCEVAKL